MRIINISVCVLVFCLMTTAQEDSLGSDYNLGRVTGPGVTMNDLGLYINEGVLLTDIFHRQVGKEDHLSFGFTVGGLGMFASGGGLGAFLFPEFDIHARIGPSSRIWAMIMPVNFFFVFGRGGGGTGFEFPFYMFNAYHWSLLSNKGKITLPKDQREHAFLFGPLLNSKQFRIDVGMFHTIRGDKDLGGIIAPSARLLVGILDNLQIGGKFLYKNLQEYQSVERDSLGFGFQVDLRHRIMGYSLFYDFLLNERGTKEFNNLIGTRLDLIVGERITSTDQVRGNWDGYFSPVLGKMQLVNTLLLKFIIKKWEYEQGPEAKQNRLDLFDMISWRYRTYYFRRIICS